MNFYLKIIKRKCRRHAYHVVQAVVPVSTCVVRIFVGSHGVVPTILRHPSPDPDVDSELTEELARMRKACADLPA